MCYRLLQVAYFNPFTAVKKKTFFFQIQLFCMFCDLEVDVLCIELEKLLVEIRQVPAARRKSRVSLPC